MTKQKDSIYFPMDGPWGSDEDKEAYKKAEEEYAQYAGNVPYVALIRSHHQYSHGYWIEFNEGGEVKYPDRLLKSQTTK